MFCLLDVSGSMDEGRKNIAKRFFMLLYLFLTRNYERIEVVFIRHHTVASEVDEDEFFTSRESGGTVVSSALELMRKIIVDRYPSSQWNIYGAQASDGDNWDNDSVRCRELLEQRLLPHHAVLCLHRDHRRTGPKPVGRIRQTGGCPHRPFRDEAHCHGSRYLPGVSRPVQTQGIGLTHGAKIQSFAHRF
jgi:hypothetical protein